MSKFDDLIGELAKEGVLPTDKAKDEGHECMGSEEILGSEKELKQESIDSKVNNIVLRNPGIEYLFSFGRKGRGGHGGEFYNPTGLVIKDNKVYVESGHFSVEIFNLDGEWVNTQVNKHLSDLALNSIEAISRQHGRIITGNKNRIVPGKYRGFKRYINKEFGRIFYILDLNGKYITSFGKGGCGKGEFRFPRGIAVQDKRIYVSDWGNHRVQVFNLRGWYAGEFGKEGSGKGEFIHPRGIVAYNNNVYVTDSGNCRIQIFDLNGKYKAEFGKEGTEKGEFKWPMDIGMHSNKLYTVDQGNHKVQVFQIK